MGRLKALILATCLAFPGASFAQDAQTLADIRQRLTTLYVEVQKLRQELNTNGTATGTGGGSALERLTSIEGELQRLTSKTEELEFRVNRVVKDGTNRIGDLEFRLCELEDGCDIGSLGDTSSLGGVDAQGTAPVATPTPSTDGPALAIGEQADFERAQGALASGDFRSAADQFAAFVQTYPGGPLTAQSHLKRGEALEQLGETTDAARAFLEAFSANPSGDVAPRALFKLGANLGALGQTVDACTTLAEVGVRFPSAPAVHEANAAMRKLGCQ
jgi:tol-pal system protein YbgF